MDFSQLAGSLAPLAAPSQYARLLQIEAPVADLVVERVHGSEALCAPYAFSIDCLSTSAFLTLEDFLAQPLTLHLADVNDAVRSWRGLCTQTMPLGSDGGLARYRLILEPWAALLRYRRNALIFQDLDVRGVIEQVFADYPAAAFRFDVGRELPVRAITTQYRETDLEFVTRLLAESGLAWRFEGPAESASGSGSGDADLDTWVIFDTQAEVPQVEPVAVRFHRSDATESDDAIASFSAQRQVVPNRSQVGSWQIEQVVTVADEAQAEDSGLPALEVFAQPRAGRFAQSEQAQTTAQARLDALRVPQTLHRGGGSVRRLAAGHAFTLVEHPNYDGASFVPLAIEHRAVNNLDAGMLAVLGSDDLERGSYRNRFVAVPEGTAIVPLPQAKPLLHGPQTATVVGLPETAITSTRDHQVRVQFAWQRGVAPNPGGLTDTASVAEGHAPGDHTTATWVPVAEWLAGPNWGSHFLPRIGSEVLVEFLHGDLDQPRVTGQLYNGQVAPPFTAGIDSPSNHPGTMSGVHTQSLDGSGIQQWGVDDAPGQLRQWLHTSLGESRLELGYLVGPGTTRGGLLGEGIALTTQGWGIVRGGEGLLLSSASRPQATSTQLDIAESVAHLKDAESFTQSLADALVVQQVPPLAANAQLTALREAVDPDVNGKYSGSIGGQSAMKPAAGSREPGEAPVEKFADPRLVAESPDSVLLTTPKSAVAFAGASLHLSVLDDAHFTAGQTFATVSGQHTAWFAQAGPLRAIAANGPLTVQANTGALELLADQSVTVTAVEDRIDVLANQKIVMQAGQSQITLEGGDITFLCPGNFTVKAAEQPFRPGASGDVTLTLPSGLVTLEIQRMLDYSG